MGSPYCEIPSPLCVVADAGQECPDPHTAGTRVRPPAQPGGLGRCRHRWRSQLEDAPAPAVTPGPAQHSGVKLMSDPIPVSLGRKEALSSLSQTRCATLDKALSTEAVCGGGTARALTWRPTKPPASVPSSPPLVSILFPPRQGWENQGGQSVSPHEHDDSRRC